MNIEKEREAFEAWFPMKHLFAYVQWSDSQKNYVYNEYDKNHVEAYEYINASLSAWQASALRAEAKLDGCVVVPVQCPEPDFADMLFDEFRKKAIGTFGDDLLIHFSDIDEEKIWALMIEVVRGGK